MAGLSTGFRVGGSSSALIKSANTIRAQLDAYQDAVARVTYENSSKTDTDFQLYSQYLSDRAKKLSSSGTIANSTKAIDVTQRIVTAQKANISSNIQRATIDVLSGNGTLTDKYRVVEEGYSRAIAIGDDALAQSLMAQAYSINQTIQYQAETSRQAAVTLGKAQGQSQDNVADALMGALQLLNKSIQKNGMAAFNQTVKDWLSAPGANGVSPIDQLKAMGVKISGGQQPGYGDIVAGVAKAVGQAHLLASQVVAPYDAAESERYMLAAQSVANGTTTFKTLAGGLTYSEVQDMAKNSGQYVWNSSKNSFQKTAQVGYEVEVGADGKPVMTTDINGKQVPMVSSKYSSSIVAPKTTQDQISQLKKLGFNIADEDAKAGSSMADGYDVQLTNKTPTWVQKAMGLKSGDIVQMFPTEHGYQIAVNDATGAQKLFTLATDDKGRSGLFDTTSGQPRHIAGNYGFNQTKNTLVNIAQKNAATTSKLNQVINTIKGIPNEIGIPGVASAATNPLGGSTSGLNKILGGAAGAQMTQRAGGGYNFTYNGKSISAATYSQLTGVAFRSLLQKMANTGDVGAKTALGFVGNDYKYDPTKMNSQSTAKLYTDLTWGMPNIKQPSIGAKTPTATTPNLGGSTAGLNQMFK